jgi:PPOX class probable F420-dependent enzyme
VANLADVVRLRGLAVVAIAREDGTTQASVVSAGVLEHPVSGEDVIGFVTRGGTIKLRLLRRQPQATVTFQAGGKWVTVEGRADLIGPDDPFDGFAPERLPQLLRDVFTGAGGTHDDWATYDRVMVQGRRTAVLVRPERIYSNPR